MSEQWAQILAIIGSNVLIILTFFGISAAMWRSSDKKIESNRKESDKKMEENRRETHMLLKSIHEEMKEFKEAIRFEMKDFHERLLKIEMERK